MKKIIFILMLLGVGCGDDLSKTTPQNNLPDMAEDLSQDTGVDGGDDLQDSVCLDVECFANSDCVEVDSMPVCQCRPGYSPVGDSACEYTNTAPVFTNLPAELSTHWREPGAFQLEAEDSDEPAQLLEFSLVSTLCDFDLNVSLDGAIDFECSATLGSCVSTLSVSDGIEIVEGMLTVTCTNSAPDVEDVEIVFQELGEPATCSYTFVDPDNDPDESLVEWFVNGDLVGTGTTWTQFEEGDQMTCRVTPMDGASNGNRVWSETVNAPLGLRISASVNHTCARATDGGMRCWGANHSGFLGVTTNMGNYNANLPVTPLGMTSNVHQITTGIAHTCALQNDDVKCWGNGDTGLLGPTVMEDSATPTTVLSGSVSQIASGDNHICAIQNGALLCWGENDRGQLGNSMNNSFNGYVSTPTVVAGLESGVTHVVARRAHTCAIKTGEVYCFGNNFWGQLGRAENAGTFEANPIATAVPGLSNGVTSIVAGVSFVCADHQGTLKCWGGNMSDQLGRVTNLESDFTPVAVTAITGQYDAIEANGANVCYTQSGALKCWGSNSWEQLRNSGSSFPNSVNVLTPTVGAFGVGQGHICAEKDGDIYCWGNTSRGRLGDGIDGDGGTSTLKLVNL